MFGFGKKKLTPQILGEFLRHSGQRDSALEMYRKSVAQGYEMAQTRINQMTGN